VKESDKVKITLKEGEVKKDPFNIIADEIARELFTKKSKWRNGYESIKSRAINAAHRFNRKRR
jgi:hypothetical protein